ncbi:MAG: adenylate/guanylate cyclase domain-containing protein [Methylobacteriaceae bacterium]|nr:adenylate/guanylate cyclase domain-containing protein [Methylobacteriaceae bacterium]
MAILDHPVSTRKLTAILSADIAGYSALMGADEEGTVRRLHEIREAVLPLIERFAGRVIDLAGDGILAEFPSAVRAVEGAAAIQSRIAELNRGFDPPMLFRIGVNVGDVIHEGDRIYGDGINVAARLQALAEPGGICISNKVHEEVRDRVRLAFRDIGDQDLKNIERPVRAFSYFRGDSASTAHMGMNRSALPLPNKPSIAVLPFQNMSGDPEQEYFADGVVEDIITALSRMRWLFVIARNSSFTYKGLAIDLKQVGRELGVRYILEGSVRKASNRVRITAQLIDVLSGAHLWAERYDRDLTDIFAAQDEVTAAVAAIIEPTLAEAEQQRAFRKPPGSLDAWDAYQRGFWHLNKFEASQNEVAQAFFRHAIEIDPSFAPGHYGLAFSQSLDFFLYQTRPWSEVAGTALEEAQIAVVLDQKDFLGHIVLAFIRTLIGEWEASIVEARIGLELNPNSAWSLMSMGFTLGWAGYHTEAIDYLHRAMRASPHDPFTRFWVFWMGLFEYWKEDYAAAADTMQEVMHQSPQLLGFAARWRAAALGQLGRVNEAKASLEKAIAASPTLFEKYVLHRAPWTRPEDHTHMIEGLRKAGWES